MHDPAKWHTATVTGQKEWDDGLFTMQLDSEPEFVPGQFATLALERDDEIIKRAYSIASRPRDPLEFYIQRVENGALTPRLSALKPGDTVLLWHKIAGGFTLSDDHGSDVLWLIGTGTGMAPYLSMLRSGAPYWNHRRVVVVHGARTAAQLGYRAEFEQIAKEQAVTYIPALTREDAPGALRGRIPDLLSSGALEEAAGAVAGPHKHHIMICGNPEMVKGMLELYKLRDMGLKTPKRPEGEIHIEKYW